MSGGWAEEVLSALGVEIVRREGNRAWCLCPFHQNPGDPKSWATSFFVRLGGKRRGADGAQYDATGQFFCFSCGEGGPLRRLVMHVRECDEAEARAFVRKRGGPRGSRVEGLTKEAQFVRRPVLFRPRFRMPPEVIFGPLGSWVTPARDYARGRGLTDEEVEAFGIGYAVDGHKLGSRIVFPWIAAGGAVSGYSARTFVDAEPRYMTPGPEEHADPSVLFGEHLWPRRGERDLVVVAEGALNALAARRAFPSAVAAFGGSKNFDVAHAAKLATFRRVLVATDPDEPGEKAALEISGMIGRSVEVLRARLPPGKDAAALPREKLLRVLERALERRS
jgi:hypothetical protein